MIDLKHHLNGLTIGTPSINRQNNYGIYTKRDIERRRRRRRGRRQGKSLSLTKIKLYTSYIHHDSLKIHYVLTPLVIL